ncbi:MAG: lytic transglycosylase domain-containing protein [bacterium]
MSLIIHDVPIECINQAAVTYGVPATMIISVLKTEGGKKGEASLNKNGTYDYGPMQINSVHLEKLAKYGITKTDLQYDPCINVAAGTWLLALSIADGKDIWRGTGDYHSHTEKHNQRYRQKVKSFHDWIVNVIKPKEHAIKS